MSYLIATTVLVGLVAVVNLLLTVGVVRRLREHTTELAELRAGRGGGSSDIALPAGAAVADFEATGIDGRSVTLATLGARPLVGFFSPHCEPCKERIPGFVEHATVRPGGADAVLAVVVGTPEDTAELADQLAPVATVVVEPDQGPVQKAFAVAGFPAFVLVEDGVVGASNYDFTSVGEYDLISVPTTH